MSVPLLTQHYSEHSNSLAGRPGGNLSQVRMQWVRFNAEFMQQDGISGQLILGNLVEWSQISRPMRTILETGLG